MSITELMEELGLESDSPELRAVRAEYELRIERLKQKARHLINVAYNRAIDDAMKHVRMGGTVDELRTLKRRVR